MIRTKKELLYYLSEDKRALKVKGVKDYIFNDIWSYQRTLRKAEYWSNFDNKIVRNLMYPIYQIRLRKKGRKLGFSIPINTFDAGLSIAHAGTIVVNKHARIGKNCRLHVCVNIGASAIDSKSAPTIGDDCYIGPGAKIYGDIFLNNNIAIGANAVVNKSFDEGNVTIAGCPAVVISESGLKGRRPS